MLLESSLVIDVQELAEGIQAPALAQQLIPDPATVVLLASETGHNTKRFMCDSSSKQVVLRTERKKLQEPLVLLLFVVGPDHFQKTVKLL